jgi:hypothetical protein
VRAQCLALHSVGCLLAGGQHDLDVLIGVADADRLAPDVGGADNQSQQVVAAVAIEVATASNQRQAGVVGWPDDLAKLIGCGFRHPIRLHPLGNLRFMTWSTRHP